MKFTQLKINLLYLIIFASALGIAEARMKSNTVGQGGAPTTPAALQDPPSALSFSISSPSLNAGTSTTLSVSGGAEGGSFSYVASGTCTVSASGADSVTLNAVSAGGCSVRVTQTVPGYVNNVNTYTVTVNPATAALLNNAAQAVSVADLTSVGVSSAITSHLAGNSCGANGASSCLSAFNTQRASTRITLAGGDAASSSQIATYVKAVMGEYIASVGDAVSMTPAPATVGCSAHVSVPLPAICAASQWSCTLANAPSGWTKSGTNIVIPRDTKATGSQSYTVRMALNGYTPAYTRNLSVTQNVTAAVADAEQGKKLFVGGSGGWLEAYNSCRTKGGDLASKAEYGPMRGGDIYYYNNASHSLTGYTVRNADAAACLGSGNTNNRYTCMSEDSCHHGTDKKAWFNSVSSSHSCGAAQSSSMNYACVNLPSCS